MQLRRRLNVKFALLLTVSCAVLGAITHFVHGIQVQRNAGAFLAQAEKAQEAGKLDAAADYLARFLALVPGDKEALASYGLLLANEKLTASSPKALLRAFFVLEHAVRRDPGRQDVRRRVIQIAMHPWLQRFSDAGQHLDKLLESVTKDGELEGLRARCYEADGDYKKARKGYEDAIAHAPKAMDNSVRLAYLLRQHTAKVRQGEKTAEEVLKRADQTMDQMIKANDRSFAAYLTRARYHKQFATAANLAETAKAAERDVRTAQQLASEEADVLLAVAELARDRKNPEEARACLGKGVQLHPKDWRMFQALAQFEVLEGQPQTALKVLRQGLEKFPKQIDLLWNLTHLLIHKGDREGAAEMAGRLRAAGFPAADLDYLDARLLITEDKWLGAARLLEHAYPQLLSRNNRRQDWFSLNLALESNLLLGRCYEQLGDPDRAAAAYGRVVARDPHSVSARLGLARTQWALGRLDSARDEYQQALLLANAPGGAWVELAKLHIVRNLRKAQPDWTEANQVLDQADKLVPPPIEVSILRAEVLVAQKDLTQAHKVLVQQHADGKTRPVEIWVGLSALEERQGKTGTALSLLDEAEKQLGDRVELRLARARYWARHPGAEAQKALARLAQNLGKLKPEEQRGLLRGLAAAYQQAGDANEAARLWRQVAELQPNDVGSRLTLFDLALQAGDQAAMKALTQELKRIEGEEGSLWRYARACRLIHEVEGTDSGAYRKLTLREARDLLDTVAKRRSGWSRLFLAQARVSELSGNSGAALARYQQAVLLGERNPAVIRRTMDLLSQRGLYLEADEMLQKLRNQTSTLGDLDRVAAELALRKQDSGQALTFAQKAVSADSRDYRDHIWLARVLWAAGQPEEADAPFRRAVALADRAPETWVAYIQYLVLTGKKDAAVAKLQEAEQNLPKDKASLPLAQCHDLIGNKDRARKLYNDALSAHPEDVTVLRSLALFHLRQNERSQAEKLLNQIIDLKTTKPSEGASARRALALVLGATGDYQQAQKALAILGLVDQGEAIEGGAAPSAADQRARVAILATQPALRQRRQAVAILEDLRRQQPLAKEEQFLLAQLYESTGEAKKAREQLMSLLTTAEDRIAKNPTQKGPLEKIYCNYLAHACQSSLRHKRSGEVELWLAKLEQLEPDTLRTLALKAQVLAKSGKAEEAVAPLKALVKDNDKLLLPVARVLEQIGQKEDAQELYEKHVAQSKRPEDVLILATFFGRRNLPGKALDLCEGAWKTCPPEAVGRCAMTVLYTAKASAGQREQVARWLEDAAKKNPKKTALLEQLAAVRRLQGRYEDVIAVYRRMIEHNEADTLTLNNLAWLLALKNGNGAEAFKVIQRAVEIGGPVAESLDTRAVIHLTMGQGKLAVKDLEEAVAETPTAHRYFHLAQAHLQANDRNAAARALGEAWRLGLSENTVDPLELPAYRQVVAALPSR